MTNNHRQTEDQGQVNPRTAGEPTAGPVPLEVTNADLAELERRNPLAMEQLKNIVLERMLREAREVRREPT